MTIAATSINDQIAGHVRSRLMELRVLPFDELEALPKTDTRSIAVSGKTIRLTVYRESRSPQEVLVVVQAVRERFFGISAHVRAEGFLASPSGEKSEAPEELLWDYT